MQLPRKRPFSLNFVNVSIATLQVLCQIIRHELSHGCIASNTLEIPVILHNRATWIFLMPPFCKRTRYIIKYINHVEICAEESSPFSVKIHKSQNRTLYPRHKSRNETLYPRVHVATSVISYSRC